MISHTEEASVQWPSMTFAVYMFTFDSTHYAVIDILPTLAEVVGAKEAGDLPLPGRSLVGGWTGGASPSRTLYFEHEGHRAIREGRWKLVALKNEPWELYDIETDRIEGRNLAANEPERVERMAAKWEVWATDNFVIPWPKDYGVTYAKPPRR